MFEIRANCLRNCFQPSFPKHLKYFSSRTRKLKILVNSQLSKGSFFDEWINRFRVLLLDFIFKKKFFKLFPPPPPPTTPPPRPLYNLELKFEIINSLNCVWNSRLHKILKKLNANFLQSSDHKMLKKGQRLLGGGGETKKKKFFFLPNYRRIVQKINAT